MKYQLFSSPRHEKVARADKSDMLLATEIRNANERHKEEPAVLQAIDNKVKEFILNRAIARDFGDHETEKELTAKLSKYLNSI